ncbi:hydroxyacid dehydrogenase [Flavobacteriaceae bacterium]|jgi:D-3-phosphoglycerate dehydrogenase|nr:hydroxyacid dehydrogenase [Flavobacteriaceae bacterium]MDC1180229.1 NAD(P)-dependent oxidoreductase [Flavobacteriaceae bacterium]
MKILHIDSNHPTLISTLKNNGYINDLDISSSKEEIIKIIKDYDGLILRSRFKIDKDFIDNASNLKFIARVGSGLENIDCNYAKSKNIEVISSPEGNSNAVGEHAMGLLLSLLNNINTSSNQVKEGLWFREKNRGFEIEGKTVAILGMGNTGKSFAKKISSFNCKVFFYDIDEKIKSKYAKKSSLDFLYKNADIVSLHLPHTINNIDLFNKEFIQKFVKPFWLINTSRGKIVNTHDLVDALNEKKILGAGLDVIDIESSSFNNIEKELNPYFNELINLKNVIITPHIAGWTFESNVKLSQIIIDKIKFLFK